MASRQAAQLPAGGRRSSERAQQGVRLRHRIDAEDAINHGVDADAIFVDPKAKYPIVKAHLQRIFSTSKAPLRSKAKPVKLRSLDDLGDRFDPQASAFSTASVRRRGNRPAAQRLHPRARRRVRPLGPELRAPPRMDEAPQRREEEFASRYGATGTRCRTKSSTASTRRKATTRGSTTPSIMC
jgi:hypothetical protein